MKLSEVILELMQKLVNEGDIELDDDFCIQKKYGEIEIS